MKRDLSRRPTLLAMGFRPVAVRRELDAGAGADPVYRVILREEYVPLLAACLPPFARRRARRASLMGLVRYWPRQEARIVPPKGPAALEGGCKG